MNINSFFLIVVVIGSLSAPSFICSVSRRTSFHTYECSWMDIWRALSCLHHIFRNGCGHAICFVGLTVSGLWSLFVRNSAMHCSSVCCDIKICSRSSVLESTCASLRLGFLCFLSHRHDSLCCVSKFFGRVYDVLCVLAFAVVSFVLVLLDSCRRHVLVAGFRIETVCSGFCIPPCISFFPDLSVYERLPP